MIFNGVDLRTVHRALSIEKEIPSGAATRGLTTVAGLGGERLVGARLEQGEYKARINIAGKTRQEAWEVRKLLAAWAYSTDQPAPLVPTWQPNVHYMAVCKEVSPPEFTHGFGTVTVSWALMRPVAVDNEYSTASGSGSVTLNILGSAGARPVITVSGASGLSLSLDGSTFLVLNSSGGTVTVDMADRSVLVGGVHRESDINYALSTWRPGFTQGRHVVSSSGGSITVRWRNEWY